MSHTSARTTGTSIIPRNILCPLTDPLMGIKAGAENLIYSSHTARAQSFLGSAGCAPSGARSCVQHTRAMWNFLCVVCKAKITPKLQPHKASAALVVSALVTADRREPGLWDHSMGDQPALITRPQVPASPWESCFGHRKNIQNRRGKYGSCYASAPKLKRNTHKTWW